MARMNLRVDQLFNVEAVFGLRFFFPLMDMETGHGARIPVRSDKSPGVFWSGEGHRSMADRCGWGRILSAGEHKRVLFLLQ
jgi:hypothetical protein